MNRRMAATRAEFLATRRSLVERLADWNDRKRWQQFFDSYWKLHSPRRAPGRPDGKRSAGGGAGNAHHGREKNRPAEIRSGYRVIQRLALEYHALADRGSVSETEKRRRTTGKTRRDESNETATIDRIADPAGFDLDAAWDEEWHRNLLQAATERVKKKVSAKQYQIFDCYVLKQWPVQKVAKELRVSVAQVYLAKHRLSALLKKEAGEIGASSLVVPNGRPRSAAGPRGTLLTATPRK